MRWYAWLQEQTWHGMTRLCKMTESGAWENPLYICQVCRPAALWGVTGVRKTMIDTSFQQSTASIRFNFSRARNSLANYLGEQWPDGAMKTIGPPVTSKELNSVKQIFPLQKRCHNDHDPLQCVEHLGDRNSAGLAGKGQLNHID